VSPRARREPMFAGIPSFMRAPQRQIGNLTEGAFVVAGVPYDLSYTGSIGMRYGPRAIREASLRFASTVAGKETVDCDTGRTIYFQTTGTAGIFDVGDFTVFPLEWTKTESSIKGSMYKVARQGTHPIIIGGDHLVSFPLLAGYVSAVREVNQGNVGYIRISSQLDLGDEDPIWGHVWRGATSKKILDAGLVRPANMVWVGVNGYVPQKQLTLAKELDLTIFTLSAIEDKGIEDIIHKAIDKAGNGCTAIYASVDLDVLDSMYVHTMGRPTFQGITNLDLLRAMGALSQDGVKALDLMGCNPVADYLGQGQVASNLAATMVFKFMLPRFIKKQ
jgi:agmatinase